MLDGIAKLQEWAEGRARRLERAVVMHGTSRFRQEGARRLARVVTETNAAGAAYGWTDRLGPDVLAPVHAVSVTADVAWDGREARTVVETTGSDESRIWQLMIRGADARDVEDARALIDGAMGWLADACDRDAPTLHEAVASRLPARFMAWLDAFRSVGFEIGLTEEIAFFQQGLRREIATLPESAHADAEAVVGALTDGARLGPALLALGHALDAAGSLPEAASTHVIGYELALRRFDASAGIDAARAAGRAHRKMAEWSAAFRWYGLARRIAEFEGDEGRMAIALDGEGNTHRERGAYPAARACYEKAWARALRSEDPGAIGTVGHSMMVVERAAGRLPEAARFGWTAIAAQPDVEARARLLVEFGTLLIEVGDVPLARRAYRLGAATTGELEMAALAYDAVAYADALIGDWGSYDVNRRIARRAAHGASPQFRAQMGYYRARCLMLEDRRESAVRMLAATERFARAYGATRWAVQAGELRDSIGRREAPPPSAGAEAPVEVRQGLARLEAELVV